MPKLIKEGAATNVDGAIALVMGANDGLGKYSVGEMRSQGATKTYAAARQLNPLARFEATAMDRLSAQFFAPRRWQNQ